MTAMKRSLATVNVPQLRKTLQWATAEDAKARRGEPSEWNQEHWFCGTTCCIAGRIALVEGWRPVDPDCAVVRKNDVEAFADQVALDALGLDSTGGLFDWNNTIDDLWEIAEALTGGELARSLAD